MAYSCQLGGPSISLVCSETFGAGHTSSHMSADEAASSSVAGKVAPRRAAAQKASKLAAEQLDSDEEDRSGPFREPSTPRSPVKVTYGGKRKYKRNPTKPHGKSSLRHSRSLSLGESSMNRPRTSNAARGRAGGRGRGGRGQKPTRTRSGSHMSSDRKSVV